MLKTPEYPHFRNLPLNAEPKWVQRLGYCTNTKPCFHSKSKFVLCKSTLSDRIGTNVLRVPLNSQPRFLWWLSSVFQKGTMVLTFNIQGSLKGHVLESQTVVIRPTAPKQRVPCFDVAWPGQPVPGRHNSQLQLLDALPLTSIFLHLHVKIIYIFPIVNHLQVGKAASPKKNLRHWWIVPMRNGTMQDTLFRSRC